MLQVVFIPGYKVMYFVSWASVVNDVFFFSFIANLHWNIYFLFIAFVVVMIVEINSLLLSHPDVF